MKKSAAPTRMPRKPRSKSATSRHREDPVRRAKLLSSALFLFAENDFSTVSTKSIGIHAGVYPSLIYYYFKDKEDIFHQCLTSLVDHISSRYSTLVAQHADPHDMIADWLTIHTEMTTDILQLLKIIIDYSRGNRRDALIDAQIRRFYELEKNVLAAAIEKGRQQEHFTTDSARRLAEFASTHLDGIMVRLIIEPTFSIAEALKALRDFLFAFMDNRR
jgi:AcrR family transcriptional regulator